MNKFSSILAIFLLGTSCLSAQLTRERPELCGANGPGLLPAELSVAPSPETHESVIKLGARGIILPFDKIDAVCALPGNQLIAFWYTQDEGVYTIRIDVATMAEIDSLVGREPAISPDMHWLIMLPSYAPIADFTATEEYLLYNLSKDLKGNEGGPVYPVTESGLPVEQEHKFRSRAFYWSSDSRSVVFADSVRNHLTVVAVSTDSEKPSTLVHSIDARDLCGPGAENSNSGPVLAMTGVEFAPTQGTNRLFTIHWSDENGTCSPPDQTLPLIDFVSPE